MEFMIPCEVTFVGVLVFRPSGVTNLLIQNQEFGDIFFLEPIVMKFVEFDVNFEV